MGTRTTVEAWLDAYQRRDATSVGELLVPAATFHVTGLPEVRGRDACVLAVTSFWDGFPDMRSEVGTILVDGNEAAWRWHYTGTHAGPFFGLDPTGRKIDWVAASFARVDGDRLAELWFYGDVESLLAQLQG